MKTLLRIDTSLRREGSYSRTMGDYFVSQWNRKNPKGKIVVRDLQKQPVPHLDQTVVDAFFAPQFNQEKLTLSDALIHELKASDEILITCPMYNFQMPSSLKAYIDHVVRVNETFKYTAAGYQGLVHNKKVYLITTRGGKKPASDYNDSFENYLVNILGFIGIQDTTSLCIDGTVDMEYAGDVVARTKIKIDELIS